MLLLLADFSNLETANEFAHKGWHYRFTWGIISCTICVWLILFSFVATFKVVHYVVSFHCFHSDFLWGGGCV